MTPALIEKFSQNLLWNKRAMSTWHHFYTGQLGGKRVKVYAFLAQKLPRALALSGLRYGRKRTNGQRHLSYQRVFKSFWVSSFHLPLFWSFDKVLNAILLLCISDNILGKRKYVVAGAMFICNKFIHLLAETNKNKSKCILQCHPYAQRVIIKRDIGRVPLSNVDVFAGRHSCDYS